MKSLKQILIASLLVVSIVGQAQTNDALANYKRIVTEMFSEIPETQVTTGLLIEKSIPSVDIAKFTGIQASDTATYTIWKKLYKQFCLAHYDYSQMPTTIDFEIEKQEDVIPMGALFFSYNQIKPEAFQNQYIVLDSAQAKFINRSPQSMQLLDEKMCFAIAPLCENIAPGTYEFSFASDNTIGNMAHSIQNITVDFNDGKGSVTIRPNSSVIVSYDSPGRKIIHASILAQNKTYVAKAMIQVGEEDNTNRVMLKSASVGIEPDIEPTEYYRNGLKAEYAVFGRCQYDGTIRKPYIIVSGFDPMDKNRMIDEGKKVNLYRVSNKNGYLDQLRNDGYDIIIYRSKESTRSIIENAYNLVSFIQKINDEKTSNNELIIAGASMGGLVVRYALTYMEYYNIDHQTKLFISVDSPQEGANVPLGIQYMVKYLNDDLVDAIEALKDAEKEMLNSDAAKEMLIYHHSGTKGSEAKCADKRTSYLAAIQKIGNFPKQCRSIAISMGSGIGADQGFAPGKLLLDKDPKMSILAPGLTPVPRITWEFSVYAVPNKQSQTIYKESVKLQTCVRLLNKTYCSSVSTLASRNIGVNNTMPIDNAPGSIQNLHNTKAFRGNGSFLGLDYLDIIEQLGDIDYDTHPDNFIPTYSALGLGKITDPRINAKLYLQSDGHITKISDNVFVKNSESDITPFDVLYVENKNLDHIYDDNREGVFSEEMISYMTKASSPDNEYLENTTVKNGHRKALEAKESVYIGNDVDEHSFNNGDVIVDSAATMHVLANEKILLAAGTKIKKGASFSAKIGNTTYCDDSNPYYLKSNDLIVADFEEDTQDIDMLELVQNFSQPILVYPSRVENTLMISSNKTDNTVTIFNVHGKKVLSKKFVKNTELDCTHLIPGVYLVQVVQSNGTTVTKQIIKQ